MIVNAYAAPSATEPLVPTTIERRDVGPNDVLIEIKYAGHLPLRHPHRPRRLGCEHLPAGRRPRDRRHRRRGRLRGHQARRSATASASAAWSTPAASARTASPAWSSTASRATSSTYGGRRPRRHDHPGRLLHPRRRRRGLRAARSPRRIPFDAAAPLLCAGITTYSPLRHWNAGPGKKVAVVGLGGLGHMAVKIAHAMGAEVTVLSQSLRKQDDGLRARAPTTTTPRATRTRSRQLANTFDLIINTVSAPLDLDAYLRAAASGRHPGQRRRPGRAAAAARVHPVRQPSLVRRARASAASRETQEMLDFCAEHGIAPEIELIARRPDQRGVRARPGLGRALPLRHRHRHARLIHGGHRSSSASPTMMPSGPRT